MIFLDFGNKTKKEPKGFGLFFFFFFFPPVFKVYFYNWGLFFRWGCTKILIFWLFFLWMCEWRTRCTEKTQVTHTLRPESLTNQEIQPFYQLRLPTGDLLPTVAALEERRAFRLPLFWKKPNVCPGLLLPPRKDKPLVYLVTKIHASNWNIKLFLTFSRICETPGSFLRVGGLPWPGG